MFLLRQILPAAAIAAMVAAGICGLVLGFGREPGRFPPGSVAVGIAYAAGHFLITGWFSFPPADTTNWLPYFGVAAVFLGGRLFALERDGTGRACSFSRCSRSAR